MAAGDVVNTCARLQSAAPVDGILVGEATYRATGRSIEYREAEPVERRGRPRPSQRRRSWRPGRATADVADAIAARRRSASRGRSPEALARLRTRTRAAARHAARRARNRQEPPGRIFAACTTSDLSAARRSLAPVRRGRHLLGTRRNGEVICRHSRCRRRGRTPRRSSAHPVSELVADADEARVGRAQSASARRARGGVELAGDRARSVRRLEPLLRGDGRDAPLVLVFEDLHWADDGLLDFVDDFVDWATGVPLLVLGTARPELLARRPGWGGGKANAVTLSLSPLSDTETAQIVPHCSSRPCCRPTSSSGCCSGRRATRSTPRSSRGLRPRGGIPRNCPRPCRESSPPASTRSHRRRRNAYRTHLCWERSSGWERWRG